MGVRSVSLCQGNSSPAGTLFTVYTCPAGRTAIVKDIRLSEAAGATTRCVVQAVSGAQQVHIVETNLSANAAYRETGAFVVLEPGDELKVFSSGGTFRFRISGAELDGVAP